MWTRGSKITFAASSISQVSLTEKKEWSDSTLSPHSSLLTSMVLPCTGCVTPRIMFPEVSNGCLGWARCVIHWISLCLCKREWSRRSSMSPASFWPTGVRSYHWTLFALADLMFFRCCYCYSLPPAVFEPGCLLTQVARRSSLAGCKRFALFPLCLVLF